MIEIIWKKENTRSAYELQLRAKLAEYKGALQPLSTFESSFKREVQSIPKKGAIPAEHIFATRHAEDKIGQYLEIVHEHHQFRDKDKVIGIVRDTNMHQGNWFD